MYTCTNRAESVYKECTVRTVNAGATVVAAAIKGVAEKVAQNELTQRVCRCEAGQQRAAGGILFQRLKPIESMHCVRKSLKKGT